MPDAIDIVRPGLTSTSLRPADMAALDYLEGMLATLILVADSEFIASARRTMATLLEQKGMFDVNVGARVEGLTREIWDDVCRKIEGARAGIFFWGGPETVRSQRIEPLVSRVRDLVRNLRDA